MSNRVFRILASLGFTYLVLVLVEAFAGELNTPVQISIALLCGLVIGLSPWGRKTDDRQDS